MGKGLEIKNGEGGTYVAYSAGTGVLVFLDLVAFLIRKELGLLKENEESMLGEGFRFILYVSF
jgi:hypothetical protein